MATTSTTSNGAQVGAQNTGDIIFRWLTAACATVVIVLIGLILLELVRHSAPAFQQFGLDFLISDNWDPLSLEFGAASSIFGTIVSTLIAIVLAAPLAIVIALFLVELAPPWLARPVGIAIELLAAVPSIIFGMWGLFVFAPIVRDHIQPFLGSFLGFLPFFSGEPSGISMLTAGMILALMILPYISAVSRDVLHMVPAVVKESAYGVGSTTWEVTKHVSLAFGIRGIIGAMFLGLGRAIGETMAVTFVIGNDPSISASLFSPGHTIASTIANEFAEADAEIYAGSLVGLGLVLFVITIIFQALAHLWLLRLRKAMER